MADFLIDNLSFLGLNQKEIKVFTALSVFGRLNMTNISSRSGLSRTTVDAIVRRLMNQGLVTQERIQGHFEYRVLLGAVADKLAWIEQRLRENGQTNIEISGGTTHSTNVSNGVQDQSEVDATDVVVRYFHSHAGERLRILFASDVSHDDKRDSITDVSEYIALSNQYGLYSEILICKVAADMLRTQEMRPEYRHGTNVMLNIVPSLYCQSAAHILVFRDSIVLIGRHRVFVREVTDSILVEAVKHLLAIACETGWSVSYQAWMGNAEPE